MILKLLMSQLIAFLLGFFVLSALWPEPSRGRTSLALRCSLAGGFGFGISSCWFFWWFCFFGAHGTYFDTFVLPELSALAVLGLMYVRVCRRREWLHRTSSWKPDRRLGAVDGVLAVILFAVALSALISFAMISRSHPHGDFDAICLWNLRARFLARGPIHWRDAFANSPGLPHPDYPLLVPATIARLWKYIGSEPVLVPIVVAFVFTFSSLGVLCSSLAALRVRRVGFFGGIVLFGVVSFVTLGAAQYADVPMAFFAMSAIVMLAFYDAAPSKGKRGFLVLAGAAMGFCAWTKNEGMLFAVLLFCIRLLFAVRQGWKICSREVGALLLGCLPVLVTVMYFRLNVAPAVYYLKVGSYAADGPMKAFLDPATTAQKLGDASRYWIIAKAMAVEIMHLGGRTIGITPLLLLYVVWVKVKQRRVSGMQASAVLIALMLVGYFVVYLTTPLILSLHLQTSLTRLLLQLWPSSVFVIFMAIFPAAQRTVQLRASHVVAELGTRT